jgi:hypothetical protein
MNSVIGHLVSCCFWLSDKDEDKKLVDLAFLVDFGSRGDVFASVRFVGTCQVNKRQKEGKLPRKKESRKILKIARKIKDKC